MTSAEKNKSGINPNDVSCKEERSFYSIQNTLVSIFKEAIQRAFPELKNAPVVIAASNNSKFGDYQCNSAMPIVQLLKSEGKKKVIFSTKIILNAKQSVNFVF